MRRSVLHRRIVAQSRNMPAAMGDYHPWGTADTPMVEPMDLITAHPQGMITYQPVTPAYLSSSATPIPATPVGVWGQVVPAGQP